MTKRMLIDAAHPEETRVVVMDGSRVEEFDLEAANRLPLKGNIYLARVVRVEPSLQAAFVEYGGNRHGFLAFDEIHPDYYQIPVADREKLLALQAKEAREEEEAEERRAQALARRDQRRHGGGNGAPPAAESDAAAASAPPGEGDAPTVGAGATPPASDTPDAASGWAERADDLATSAAADTRAPEVHGADSTPEAHPAAEEPEPPVSAETGEQGLLHTAAPLDTADAPSPETASVDAPTAAEEAEPRYGRVEQLPQEDMSPPETLGGPEGDGGPEGGPEAVEDDRPRRAAARFLRGYKIQEVIRRRQILLVQVVKEERGNKGAALTTYISLAGRFSVLMPNTPRGGGISRKITSAADRRRLREVIDELEMPEGMSLIVRTAGANRPKPEIRRDCEYLLQLWDGIRERTLASSAPALIYEEADLIKRCIRDGTAQQMDEILVEGDDAYATAREFVRMLMPEQARKIQAYRDGAQPLFARFGAEQQLDAMHEPVVQLRSGGYIVINQTEALVAIDVNSGRATRERHIEDTAFKTNCEAAEEVARQLRLRDLAGLIVVDFIDMDSAKNNAAVEKRLKEALRHDRARIQVGRISHFGLLEMSRQRLRPSLAEQSFVQCPHCAGRGLVRSVESSGIAVLRAIEEEGARRRSSEIVVRVATPVALWLLNRKRDRLADIEARWGMAVLFEPDDSLQGAETKIERSRTPPAPTAAAAAAPPAREANGSAGNGGARPPALRMDFAPVAEEPADDDDDGDDEEDDGEEGAESRADVQGGAPGSREGGEGERGNGRRRRRRRRGGARRDGTVAAPGGGVPGASDAAQARGDDAAPRAEGDADDDDDDAPRAAGAAADGPPGETEGEREARRRRRGRRGGRRRREEGDAPPGGAEPREGATRAEGLGDEDDAARVAPPAAAAAAAPALGFSYAGPTPADPFSGGTDSLIAAMEAAEAAALAEAEARRASRASEAAPPPPSAAPVPPTAEEPREAPPAASPPPPAGAPEPDAPPPVAGEVAAPDSPAAGPEPAAPSVGPAVQPKLVEEASTPRRGGWWKR